MLNLMKMFKKKLYLNSQISILDNNELLIENCKNILECNENLIKILSNNYEVEAWGTNLYLTNYASGSVVVKGCISSISIFERRKYK